MAKNIEMNYYNGSAYEVLYPASISNLIQLSETLLDRLGLDNGTIDDIISSSSSFAQATTGCIFWYASQTIPEGFLLCDGSLISRNNYAGLFAIIGTTFGAGDGSTTFGVPDLRAKFVRGAGTNNGYSANFGATKEATGIGKDGTVGTGTHQLKTITDTDGIKGDVYRIRPYNIALTPIIKY